MNKWEKEIRKNQTAFQAQVHLDCVLHLSKVLLEIIGCIYMHVVQIVINLKKWIKIYIIYDTFQYQATFFVAIFLFSGSI